MKQIYNIAAILAIMTSFLTATNENLFLREKRGVTNPISTTKTTTKEPKRKDLEKNYQQRMNFKGENIDLNLTLNEQINSNIPIILANRNSQRQMYAAEPFSAYYDKKNSVNVILKMKRSTNGTLEDPDIVHGMMAKNGKVYKFGLSQSNGKNSNMNVDNKPMDFVEEDAQFLASQCKALASKINSTIKTLRKKRQSFIGAFTVETLIVVDYSLYNRFFQLSNKTTATLKSIDAQANILYYFVNVANGVVQRFQTVPANSFTINVRLVGIYIAMDPTSSYFTDSSYFRMVINGETLIDGIAAYTQFKLWTTSYAILNGRFFDQATLFTNYRMYIPNTNGPPGIATGLGHIGTMCDISNVTNYESYSTTINSERGLFASMGTMAHEMGHNLKSNHDGDGNSCTYVDQFIMAGGPGPLNANNFNNIFKFSTCSNYYMSNFLSNLQYTNPSNCLTKTSSTSYNPPIDQRLPGIKFSIDDQCRIIFGTNSYYCAGDHQTLCLMMECYNPAIQKCEIRVDIRAFEGSQCGNKKWCIGGNCVQDMAAPASASALDTCLYGDYKGTFGVGTNPAFKCSQIYVGSADMFRCYDSNYVFTRCCSACAKISSQFPPNCPYGDSDPAYCLTGTKSRCYESQFSTTCCATCAKWKVNKPGCEYGDKYPETCAVTSNYCYQLESSCCDTCSKYLDPTQPNCKYGDRVTWCNTLNPFPASCSQVMDSCCKTCRAYSSSSPTPATQPACRNVDTNYCANLQNNECYTASSRDYCCAKCAALYTGITGCEYGDHSPWCSSYVTSSSLCDASITLNCCDACRKINKTNPLTPVTPVPFNPACSDTDATYCSQLRNSDCYYQSTNAYCCATCKKYYTNTPGCEYGDRASWCSSYVTGISSCYDPSVVTNCCSACAKYGPIVTTTTTKAPCSDQAYWCSTLFSGQCYDAQTEATCCVTCYKFKRANTNCKYGDKYSWCAPQYCGTDKANCCVSCP